MTWPIKRKEIISNILKKMLGGKKKQKTNKNILYLHLRQLEWKNLKKKKKKKKFFS